MFEFANDLRDRHVEITVAEGAEAETYSGIVRRVYSNFVMLTEDGTGRTVYINQSMISSVCVDPDDTALDEKKKKRLFG
ncbi:MAG: hypothetical protein K6B74_07065 [Ruminococcus sp.]|nr:hypothetical protein [Ruminococcus sp.]